MKRVTMNCLLVVLTSVIGFVPEAKAVTYGQEVVAAVLLGEARGEGEIGMMAVAEVIRNRADKEGVSPLAIVTRSKQFACLNRTTPKKLIRKFWRTNEWKTALRISRLMYNQPEKLPGITNGATHFDSGDPYWAQGKKPVAVIGNHKFFILD